VIPNELDGRHVHRKEDAYVLFLTNRICARIGDSMTCSATVDVA